MHVWKQETVCLSFFGKTRPYVYRESCVCFAITKKKKKKKELVLSVFEFLTVEFPQF